MKKFTYNKEALQEFWGLALKLEEIGKPLILGTTEVLKGMKEKELLELINLHEKTGGAVIVSVKREIELKEKRVKESVLKLLRKLAVFLLVVAYTVLCWAYMSKKKEEPAQTLKNEFTADYIDGELKPTLESVDSLEFNLNQ